jgi:hypothetical protein
MFANDIERYSVLFIVVVAVSFAMNKLNSKQAKTSDEDEYNLIRTYLLNESPLYGYNKPKLWIHTKYEVNSRNWESFGSRTSSDLNQPYIHLTVKSIINHCGDDFNICLIDDKAFSKLIPMWNIDVVSLPDPKKSLARELGLVELVAIYGGIVVPNSFLCNKNLMDLYLKGIANNNPFICEMINRNDLNNGEKRILFSPNTKFIGSKKNSPILRDFTYYLKNRLKSYHIHSEEEFLGESSKWCLGAIQQGNMTLLGGEYIGVKNNKGIPITLEQLMEDEYLDLHPDHFGILIPHDEILNRVKYQWFAYMSSTEVLNTSCILSKYLQSSFVDTNVVSLHRNPGVLKSNVGGNF